MAVEATSPNQEPQPALLSRIISHFLPISKSKTPQFSQNAPQDTRPPLHRIPLPLVLDQHSPNLALQGWTTVTFPRATPDIPAPHPLQTAYEDLFIASKAFFSLPIKEKQKWKTKLGSEEGWSSIEGEKEFITIRSMEGTPDVLKDAAARYWTAAGDFMDGMLERVSESLEMDGGEGEGGLRRFVGPCKRLQERDVEKTATMLRLFRYEGDEKRVVAEPHSDLGLLSMVTGDTPGLEVWDLPSKSWFQIEKSYNGPASSLLVGRQLERLSNFRYRAGGHLVRAYGPNPNASQPSDPSLPKQPNYRYSIVFVLRAHKPVIVDTDLLTTKMTGKFENPIKGITAGTFYEQISNAHFNINTNMKERDEQRKKIAAKKAAMANGSG
ncbi:hypothetical protein K432DRAFT_415242 [Lepidopterella palustris CBS 459.81]|uniref:Isopenicillin N synthase-like Fe(2+) 2OG dioxygenase domain-containing protein n=1 Tax=Lepidopterella palustris CBS 459.81 TaxID=1314670 RepID=A0A8E2EEM1_9PEZI|nr:hypothetical protein K432DRAFT_415242 [Lepidopterella palustris CBS 459.81]